MKKVYSLQSEEAVERGLLEFEYSLEEYCDYISSWYELMPDGILELLSFRTCVSSAPIYTFISSFQYKGNMMRPDINLLTGQSDHLSAMSHHVSPQQGGKIQSFYTHGSLVVYVNKAGHIETIEFFFEDV
jgi:hypothetical protein